MVTGLMWVLELFVAREKRPEFLRDGVEAILTMSKIKVADRLWSRQYVGDDQAAKILGWLVAPPLGAGYPLLGQDNDLVVREFLRSAHQLAGTLFDVVGVRQFAAGVLDLLIEHGRYLMAGEWCTICDITELSDDQLICWGRHLTPLGQERVEVVIAACVGSPSAEVHRDFKAILAALFAEAFQ